VKDRSNEQNMNIVRKLGKRSFDRYKVVNIFYSTCDVNFVYQTDERQSRSAPFVFSCLTCADYCRSGVYNGAAIRIQIGVLIG